MHDVAAGRAACLPTRDRASRRASVVNAGVLGFGRMRHALRRHRAHAQLAQHALPRRAPAAAGRRGWPISRFTGSFGRLTACGCCGSRRSTDSATPDISPRRPRRRRAAPCGRSRLRPLRGAGCARGRARRRRAARSRCAAQHRGADPDERPRCHDLLHCVGSRPASSSSFFVFLSRRRQRRRHRRRIVRAELHQLAQRGDDVLTRVALRLLGVRESLLLPGGGGGSGFSASSSGVRLSLLTASSFAPAAASARMIATCRAVHRLMQRRRAVRRLGVRIGAGGEQHLDARRAGSRFDASRNGGATEAIEPGTGGERRAAAADHRHHHRRLADVGVAAAAAGGCSVGLPS